MWIVLAIVGRHPVLTDYRTVGGKIDRAFAQDPTLRDAVEACKNSDGHLTFTGDVYTAFDRVLRKTAQGLYYGLYGRVPALDKFKLLSIEHSQHRTPDEVVSRHRKGAYRDISDEPLPTLSSRGLPNVHILRTITINAATGAEHTMNQKVILDTRQEAVEWIEYQAGALSFTFFQDEAGGAICVMNLWGTLISAVQTPWPSQRGSLRRGRKNPNARP